MIGIIGAMAEEVAILKSEMSVSKIEKIGRLEFILGYLVNTRVVLLQCGIGKVNAALGAALMIERYLKYDADRLQGSFIINSGCAGGTNPAGTEPISFGDVVVSTSFVQHDFDLTAFGRTVGEVPGLPPIFDADKRLIEAACRAIDALKREGTDNTPINYVRGLIASGDVFMHDPQRIAVVQNLFPAMRALEMEGAAIAQVCIQLQIPFVAIRALSDIAGKESPMTFDEYLPIAAKNSSDIVRGILEVIS
ncbi:MAG: 5'-methylthioadenosine/S-adenosylhomocysteine nucleosidase [Termitinemataceae bacterium]|nr:MAG: 5'-methylthioadenosine/S-adenosylhomocysteine nucleosidase [Termitinemataceae bacterium]